MFEFCCFRSPALLRWDGREIRLRLQERVILLVVACAADLTLPARVIIERLWHGEPADGAAITLRSHVHNIRAAVRRVAGPVAAMTFLSTLRVQDGAAYGLGSSVLVDVRRWERELAAARETLLWEPSRQAEADLEAIASAWRDTVFGDAQEWHFARAERDRLAELHKGALIELADFRAILGRHRDAVAVLRPLTVRFPGDYGVWERLILALWHAKLDQAAAQTCQDCTRALNRFGLDVSEIHRLHQAILTGTLPR